MSTPQRKCCWSSGSGLRRQKSVCVVTTSAGMTAAMSARWLPTPDDIAIGKPRAREPHVGQGFASDSLHRYAGHSPRPPSETARCACRRASVDPLSLKRSRSSLAFSSRPNAAAQPACLPRAGILRRMSRSRAKRSRAAHIGNPKRGPAARPDRLGCQPHRTSPAGPSGCSTGAGRRCPSADRTPNRARMSCVCAPWRSREHQKAQAAMNGEDALRVVETHQGIDVRPGEEASRVATPRRRPWPRPRAAPGRRGRRAGEAQATFQERLIEIQMARDRRAEVSRLSHERHEARRADRSAQRRPMADCRSRRRIRPRASGAPVVVVEHVCELERPVKEAALRATARA